MLFSRTACLALVCFARDILPYVSKLCNKKSGSQPTRCEPFRMTSGLHFLKRATLQTSDFKVMIGGIYVKKCILCLSRTILAVTILRSCCLPVAYASSYHDVADSDWHTEAIEYVKEIGLMAGTGNGNFQPDQLLTRAQIVAILHRLAGSPEAEYIRQFQDVPADAWYARSVAWAYQKGIVHGISESTFSPASNINREQLAVIIYNYLKSENIELQDAENALWRVKDCWSVSYYAEDGVVMVCETGLMNPDQQHNFNPRNGVTRADAAVVFMRLSKALAGERLTGMMIPNTKIDFTKFSQKEKDASALAVAQQIASVIPSDRDDAERIAMAAHIRALAKIRHGKAVRVHHHSLRRGDDDAHRAPSFQIWESISVSRLAAVSRPSIPAQRLSLALTS